MLAFTHNSTHKNLLSLPMNPPHMPPMAKMETAMAYMKVEDSYVMFTPSERWR